jgi:hypothetical protein
MGFHFFCAASRHDWLDAFGSVKRGTELQFYRTGFYPSPSITSVKLEEIEGVDVSETGQTISEPSYYVLLPEQSIVLKQINMSDGTTKYVIDRYSNDLTFIFRLGGLYENSFWIISEISSVWGKGGSVDVAKRMMSYARRHWYHESYFWIGPDCHRKFHSTHTFTEDSRNHLSIT